MVTPALLATNKPKVSQKSMPTIFTVVVPGGVVSGKGSRFASPVWGFPTDSFDSSVAEHGLGARTRFNIKNFRMNVIVVLAVIYWVLLSLGAICSVMILRAELKVTQQEDKLALLIEFWILRIALGATALLFVIVPHCSILKQMPSSHSNTAIDGIVKQHIGNGWQPLAFFLKQLGPAYAKYSSYESEYLSAYSSKHYFQHTLEGRTLILCPDRKALTYAFSINCKNSMSRRWRHLDLIADTTAGILADMVKLLRTNLELKRLTPLVRNNRRQPKIMTTIEKDFTITPKPPT
uniref:Reverse transcriptase RNase H-like domain-containing protein n=1 Tax=Glossina pallidipes TaxID=7398 RepID=A0A1B0A7A6_GLOPL